ncbi:MAG: lytic transglycosylase domain-containing protein [Bacteroidota bacterium]
MKNINLTGLIPISKGMLMLMGGISFVAVISSFVSKLDLLENKTAEPAMVIKSITLQDTYEFAGEKLTIEDWDIRERLERELYANVFQHSSTIIAIKRSMRYFPLIEKKLAEHGLPSDLKYIAVAESMLSNAVSPAGAKGVWQLMKPVSEFYGLEISEEVDERYHVEKATEIACKYLKHLHKRFGNWSMAAAAYNIGETRFKKELDFQRAKSYFDMQLNEETSRYVFRLFAIKAVLEDPEYHGYQLNDNDGYAPVEPTKMITVAKPIPDLGLFAQENNISYRKLKWLNPWLISKQLTNPLKKEYQIRLLE